MSQPFSVGTILTSKNIVYTIFRQDYVLHKLHCQPSTCWCGESGRGGGGGCGQEGGHDLDGEREDDGGVVLGGDAAQGLQVAQLGECRGCINRVLTNE